MPSTSYNVIPEIKTPVSYESTIKSGTHGGIHQKQLAQVLLLRMTRARMDFQLAYELTAADKFDNIGIHDKKAQQWIFIHYKHADGKQSKIDQNGLLPKMNREKGDFSLYKYFQSYMTIRSRFEGKIRLMLFTNKSLDGKLQNSTDCVTFENRDVDKCLQFSHEGATHKKLLPTEEAVQSIIKNANKDFYSLKQAIKDLFIDGIITKELIEYDLTKILEKSGNNKIRFKKTFNCSLNCIAQLHKDFKNINPVQCPPDLVIVEPDNQITNCPSVDSSDFKELKDGIRNLFEKGVVSKHLKQYKSLLNILFTTNPSGQLISRDNNDVICLAELYNMLSNELEDMKKVVKTKRKLFVGKTCRSRGLPLLAEASDVRNFFDQLTLAVRQPSDLCPFIIRELSSWMRIWLRPDVLGKLTEEQEHSVVKAFEVDFEAQLKIKTNNLRDYLDQHFLEKFYNKLRIKIEEFYPELKDARETYISRLVIVEADYNVENIKTDTASGNPEQLYHNKKDVKMTDKHFARILKRIFTHYQSLIMTADPGMGKTKFLQYVALEYQKLNVDTVFLLYLNRLQGYETHSKNNEGLGILQTSLSDKNIKLIRNILNMESNHCITMFFDGYDEVVKKNRNKIHNLFKKLLKSKNLHLIVSTRKIVKHILHEAFERDKITVKFTSLEPFSEQNSIEYLAKSWNCGMYVNHDFYFFSKYLVNQLNASFNVLGSVPLMIRIAAVTYKENFEKFRILRITDKESYLPRVFSDIDHIYESFITRALRAHVKDMYYGTDIQNLAILLTDGFIVDYQMLAIEFLDIDELNFVFKNPKYIEKGKTIFKQSLVRSDEFNLITIVDDKAYFSHHTYAEYFVATFLWDNFFDYYYVVERILKKCSTIRKFVMKMIENDLIVFQQMSVVQEQIVSENITIWACECNAINLLNFILSK
ncbi:uncharacterized protein LOC110676958 [Aedes aegypti]|uniref:NACHT domain-containing protein n=1 Tax=Aedes aegypti TaxID=7159 RepID=A0A6I8U5V6_AEDAE|nr:uncharacterized protein LOC110676958 [Aedes aegypti]